MASTHHATRDGSGVSVSTSNLRLLPGRATPAELIGSVRRGLYVTELIGFGVNSVTGDYSRGAVGLWIENGELAYPVEEITVAGNLLEMFQAVDGVGADLVLRGPPARPPPPGGRRGRGGGASGGPAGGGARRPPPPPRGPGPASTACSGSRPAGTFRWRSTRRTAPPSARSRRSGRTGSSARSSTGTRRRRR